MKNEKLKKQIKHLSKFIPKNIILSNEQKERELTKAEMKVIQSYLEFYKLYNFVPLNGMKIKHFSEKSYIDFAFMNIADDQGRFCIYLNLK